MSKRGRRQSLHDLRVIIADNTLLSTRDHQRIMGGLIAAHGLLAKPDAIYGYAPPAA